MYIGNCPKTTGNFDNSAVFRVWKYNFFKIYSKHKQYVFRFGDHFVSFTLNGYLHKGKQQLQNPRL